MFFKVWGQVGLEIRSEVDYDTLLTSLPWPKHVIIVTFDW